MHSFTLAQFACKYKYNALPCVSEGLFSLQQRSLRRKCQKVERTQFATQKFTINFSTNRKHSNWDCEHTQSAKELQSSMQHLLHAAAHSTHAYTHRAYMYAKALFLLLFLFFALDFLLVILQKTQVKKAMQKMNFRVNLRKALTQSHTQFSQPPPPSNTCKSNACGKKSVKKLLHSIGY